MNAMPQRAKAVATCMAMVTRIAGKLLCMGSQIKNRDAATMTVQPVPI